MAGYWGATADPNYGVSPYSGQLHYVQHQYSNESFTPAAGDGNNLTIEEIEMRIMNAHPERIAALADQWQNAWSLMTNVRTYVLAQSTVLHDEHWKSPEARDAFLQKGPGEALAYLDVWMEAANKNIVALRHLVNITQDARTEMTELMRQYRIALRDAQVTDITGQASEWFDVSRYWLTTWEDARDYQIEEQVNSAKTEFTRRAQELAHRIGDQHFDYTGQLSSGMGPPFRPMDAVINAPGAPPRPNLPGGGLPGGAPGAPPPPLPVNPLNTVAPAPPPPPAVAPPPGVVPPVPVANPALPPGVPGPPLVAPPPGVLPVGPPGVAPPAPAPRFANQPVAPPGGLPGGARAPGGAPGSLPPAAPRAANPGQLTRNAFNKNPGGLPPGATQPPGRTLRRPDGAGGQPGQPGRGMPGAPGQPGRGQPGAPGQPGRRQPGRPGEDGFGRSHGTPQQPGTGQPGRPGERRRAESGGERAPGAPIDSQEAFGRPQAPTAPPVLKNPTGDRSRQRPGSAGEIRMQKSAGSSTGFGTDGTAPPVLNRPNRTAETAPPPGRTRPGTPGSRPERKTPPGTDWVGADEARAEAGAPVLDAPAPPTAGRGPSRLEEVPKDLRSRAATRPTTGPPARPGTVSPELSKRRTDEDRQQRKTDEESPGVISDEQAFEVQTPGGGVLTSQRDETYEPEVRRALGGNR